MLDFLVLIQVFGSGRMDDLSSAQDVDMIGVIDRKAKVLFYQENGDAALLQFPNDLSDRLNEKRRKSFRGFIHQE